MTYGTRRLRAGDTFAAKDSHARLLIALGRAVVAAETKEEAVAEDQPETEPKRRARRAYKRRDMKAED